MYKHFSYIYSAPKQESNTSQVKLSWKPFSAS